MGNFRVIQHNTSLLMAAQFFLLWWIVLLLLLYHLSSSSVSFTTVSPWLFGEAMKSRFKVLRAKSYYLVYFEHPEHIEGSRRCSSATTLPGALMCLQFVSSLLEPWLLNMAQGKSNLFINTIVFHPLQGRELRFQCLDSLSYRNIAEWRHYY